MRLPTLYSIDSKGVIRRWEVSTDGDTVVVTHGVDGGKMQEKRTKCKAKNVGRANATTPEQQAEAEAHSKWKQQIEREDYAEKPEDANKQLRPMLAHDFHKVPHRVKWDEVMAQPKLDGLRLTTGFRWIDRKCMFEMMSRKGDYYHVPHLFDEAERLLTIINDHLRLIGIESFCQAIDGEAYIHGVPLPKITSLARKYQQGETEKLEYHVFDLVIPDIGFKDRYDILQDAIEQLDNPAFVLVPLFEVNDEDSMKALHGHFVEEGYEGLMIRHRNSEYKIGGRSADLFKFKLFFDEECQITDVWEDNNGNAMLTTVRKNGITVKVTPKRTHDERKALLGQRDQLIGKWITVKYQAETPDGSLQFPVGLDLRECDENGEPIL